MIDPPALARSRLRPLSIVVLLVVAVLSIAGCIVTRQVVRDQEHKLLQQRAEEAGLYMSSLVSSVQTELASLAASASATDKDPEAFQRSTALLTTVPGGFSRVVLVSASDPSQVLASSGDGLPGGMSGERRAAIETAVAKIGLTGSLVATPLLTEGDTKSLGFAYASPALPAAVIYAESVITSTISPTTDSQPFNELIAAVYAVPAVRADQLVAVSGPEQPALPLTGDTVSVTSPIGQGEPWLLVAKARHSLVGSVATSMPWAILLGGLVVALLATAIVETMARRREYADSLVASRTEELEDSLVELAAAHEQLVRQERLAAIGELASTIGHEMRNPLGVISNAVYLLRSDLGAKPSEAAQRHLATAEREISAATVIVSDLLEFARQREPVPDDVDVPGLVEEVLTVLPPPAGVSAEPVDRSRAVTVRADRDMLRQVLLNLVSNAYQAMPDGGTLAVDASAEDGAVQISVRDTGVGISEEVRARLFEPFFTTKARGVGLGLVVSRRIVEAHGGALTVDGAEGTGTEFRVVLPNIAAARTPADAQIVPSEATT